jgi:transcription antitermination factor NusG
MSTNTTATQFWTSAEIFEPVAPLSNASLTSQWFALTVKPQHERVAAQALESKGLEFFLPLYRARRRWSDRIKESSLPLFPGYVFCRFACGERAQVLATPSVRSVVSFGRTPAPVVEEELHAVRSILASGLLAGPWPFLNVGQTVRIEAGPLSGLEGILVQLKDVCRVVVSVQLLQRSVAVEIDRDVLRPVGPAVRAHQ